MGDTSEVDENLVGYTSSCWPTNQEIAVIEKEQKTAAVIDLAIAADSSIR